MVDLGFITSDDREAALEVQRESGGLLGEILITQGKLTRLELANALSEHWESATDAGSTTGNRRLSLIDGPLEDESSRSVEPSTVAELRRLLAELEAARIADVQAAEARITAIDDALAALTQRDDAEFRRATTERLQQLADTIESSVPGSPDAVDLDARLATLAGSTAELRSELEALAARQADLDELTQARAAEATRIANDELRERLDKLIALRTTDLEANQAAHSQAAHASAETSRIEQTLRSELDALIARQAEAEPNQHVNELEQAIHTLAHSIDERLDALATQLRAETTTRTDDIPTQLRARTDELAASIDALRETVASNPAKAQQDTDTRADEPLALAARLDELSRARAAEAEATRIANDELRERLDKLIALRTTDLEASQAAHSEAAHATAESSRIEQTLAGALAELAVQVDDLARRLDDPSVEERRSPAADREPVAEHAVASLHKVGKKQSKRAKNKKKPKG